MFIEEIVLLSTELQKVLSFCYVAFVLKYSKDRNFISGKGT